MHTYINICILFLLFPSSSSLLPLPPSPSSSFLCLLIWNFIGEGILVVNCLRLSIRKAFIPLTLKDMLAGLQVYIDGHFLSPHWINYFTIATETGALGLILAHLRTICPPSLGCFTEIFCTFRCSVVQLGAKYAFLFIRLIWDLLGFVALWMDDFTGTRRTAYMRMGSESLSGRVVRSRHSRSGLKLPTPP